MIDVGHYPRDDQQRSRTAIYRYRRIFVATPQFDKSRVRCVVGASEIQSQIGAGSREGPEQHRGSPDKEASRSRETPGSPASGGGQGRLDLE